MCCVIAEFRVGCRATCGELRRKGGTIFEERVARPQAGPSDPTTRQLEGRAGGHKKNEKTMQAT
jgi:hypothetical protein